MFNYKLLTTVDELTAVTNPPYKVQYLKNGSLERITKDFHDKTVALIFMNGFARAEEAYNAANVEIKIALDNITSYEGKDFNPLNIHVSETTIKDAIRRNNCGAVTWGINKEAEAIKAFEPGNDFEKIAAGIAEVLTEKNKRYGNSALKPINVFNGKSKVGQRADDKVSRIQNSPVLRKNDVADLIGYLFLICQENNWTCFKDQID